MTGLILSKLDIITDPLFGGGKNLYSQGERSGQGAIAPLIITSFLILKPTLIILH